MCGMMNREPTTQPAMETRTHRLLKRLAVRFLRSRGVHAAAMEVTCPISNYRVDVAGWQDRFSGFSNAEPRTIVIECKQDRSDFLRDSHQMEGLLARRRALTRIRRAIERERIPIEEPHLRANGSSLFPEMDTWDYAASRLPGYAKVLRKLRRIDEQLHGETKFHRIAHYRLADQLYVLAPRGIVRRCEVPPGWGLLECPKSWFDDEASRDRLDHPPLPSVAVEAPALMPLARHRDRLLRNIAVAASYAAIR